MQETSFFSRDLNPRFVRAARVNCCHFRRRSQALYVYTYRRTYIYMLLFIIVIFNRYRIMTPKRKYGTLVLISRRFQKRTCATKTSVALINLIDVLHNM